jgi:formylglycine-generating enzyme
VGPPVVSPAVTGCCGPSRPAGGARPGEIVAGDRDLPLNSLSGGWFLMGCDDPIVDPADGEGPVRRVWVDPFRLAPTAVSVAQFADFVGATGYRTDAERFGTSFVFAGLLPDDAPPTRAVAAAPWWRQVEGAGWRTPQGPGSVADPRHPVVHVSWNDATAYCRWSGTRLPTEAEWEYACRGRLEQARFPWGNRLLVDGEHRMNVWQGRFPDHNTARDGYAGTAPVDAYAPNGFGLYCMTGNVWEWVADRFGTAHDLSGAGRRNPCGPAVGEARVTRGGSYLCHASYCARYRTSARMGNTPDSSTGNTGFRVAAMACLPPSGEVVGRAR